MSEKETQPSASILVIEDDRSLREGLALNLRLHGFQVQTAEDGEQGMLLAFNLKPDLILLDLMLPGYNGLEILEELRAKRLDTAVLILSARGTTENKVEGLGLGADDYMHKPFELPELLARCEALLRRRRQEHEKIARLSFGSVSLDRTTRMAWIGSRKLELSAKEFDLLALLARSPGRVFTREEILNQVWGHDFEGTSRTVDNFILALRQKVEPDPAKPRYLKTVRQVGYRLEIAQDRT